MNRATLEAMQGDLRRILQERCIRQGTFVLASGVRSNYFFDGKLATLSPDGSILTGHLIFNRLRGQGIEAVGGKELGANPIVTAVSLISSMQKEPMPGFIVRSNRKDHGLEERIAESYTEDGRPLISRGRIVAIVDDVATSGQSCMDAVNVVVAEGCQVAKIIVLVDRQQGAAQFFHERGYNFEALYVSNFDGRLSDWVPTVKAR
jgi:orotate phosphoribosyltransferase